MEQQGVFKTTTFGGFEKSSVLKYIDELNLAAKKTEEEMNQKVDELTTFGNELQKQAEEAKGQWELVKVQLEESQSNTQQLKNQLSNMDAELERYKKLCNDKDREIQIQTERARQLQQKAESFEQKSKKYDDISGEIGTVVLEAKQQAQQIIDTANEEAKGILENARKVSGLLGKRVEEFKGEFLEMRNNIAAAMGLIDSKLDEIEENIEDAYQIAVDGVQLPCEEALLPDQEGEDFTEKFFSEDASAQPQNNPIEESFFR